jgi:hypothetical protein
MLGSFLVKFKVVFFKFERRYLRPLRVGERVTDRERDRGGVCGRERDGVRNRDRVGVRERVRERVGVRVGVRDLLGIVGRVAVCVYVGTQVGVLDEEGLGEDVCE